VAVDAIGVQEIQRKLTLLFTAPICRGAGTRTVSPRLNASLLTGLRLMGHGWPQGTVVGLLRRLRPELEKHHARILRQPASILSDEQQRLAARPGDVAVGNLEPLFLVVVSEQGRRGTRSVALCRGQREVFELYHKFGPGYAFTLTEVATSVHALSSALAQTRPRPRGRSRA
jgi:hypothetical protein